MSNRHRAREVALQVLYRFDVAAQSANTTAAALVRDRSPQELLNELNQHFDHFQVSPDLREFAARLVSGTLHSLTDLDALLETHAANWKISRMGFVDRSLLLMALYELVHMKETPASVVIDEAIELGKQFGNAETPAFLNGILDAANKEIVKKST
jgi:N utilization substance protein B